MLFSPQLVFLVSILPLFSLSTYIVFFKQRHSFAEHFIAGTYVFAYSVIVCTVLSDAAYFIFGLSANYTAALFQLVMFAFGVRVFASQKHWYHFVWYVLLILLMFILLLLLIVGLLYLINPDWIKFSTSS